MKKTLVVTAVIALTLLLTGCGGGSGATHESLEQERINTIKEYATALEGITDVASAKAAVPKLEELATKMVDIKKRKDGLGKPTPEQQKAVNDKLGIEMNNAMLKWGDVGMKLMDKHDVWDVISEIDRKFRNTLG